MKFFSSQPDNSATGLLERSQLVLSVFTKTMNDLKEINEAAKGEISLQESIIKNAEQEKAALEKLTADNNKVIENIDNILK